MCLPVSDSLGVPKILVKKPCERNLRKGDEVTAVTLRLATAACQVENQ